MVKMSKKMNIRQIINEEIQKVLLEKKGKKSKSGGKKHKKEKEENPYEFKGIRKNAIKKRGGKRGDFDYFKQERENAKINSADNNLLADRLDDDTLNIAAIARKLYPDHTPEGAQSQLRKKIKKERSDSGGIYTFRKKESKKLNTILNNIGK